MLFELRGGAWIEHELLDREMMSLEPSFVHGSTAPTGEARSFSLKWLGVMCAQVERVLGPSGRVKS